MTDRREQILEAARELLSKNGVQGVSVRAVAARAGIGASTLRHYFPTQDALFEATLQTALAGQLDDVVSDRRISDRRVRPADRLFECVEQFLPNPGDAATLDQWFGMVSTAVGPHRTDLGVKRYVVLTDRTRQRVLQWMATLHDEGVLTAGVGEATDVVLSMIDGVCLQVLYPGDGLGVERARTATRLVVDSLVTTGR